MVRTAVLGFPRIGFKRELKRATEAYWRGELSEAGLQDAARQIRLTNWRLQREAGIDEISSNDFSLYDHILDMTALLGAVPPRFGWKGGPVDLDTYFAMARGLPARSGGAAAPAMEMTKWFDTNYHYIVPEFWKGQTFSRMWNKPFEEFKEAQASGISTRPVLVGPVTYLLLGKPKDGVSRFDLLPPLLAAYVAILKEFESLGAASVQMDEPSLVTDLDPASRRAFQTAYRTFAQKVPDLPLMLTTYFGPLGNNTVLAAGLPVAGLHVDLTSGAFPLKALTRALPKDRLLSLGAVSGRNIWKNDSARTLAAVRPVVKQWGETRCLIASSCSLLHAPLQSDREDTIEPVVKRWLAFASEKLGEIALIRDALSVRDERVAGKAAQSRLRAHQQDVASRKTSSRVRRQAVQKRLRTIAASHLRRRSPFKLRQPLQHKRFALPLFPTTTIGSFPQTPEIRQSRADFKSGVLSQDRYDAFLRRTIEEVIRRQEELGLDALVHGEPERNDMVEYFGEQLDGVAITRFGWVQSYGTRYVKPPIIYGDVSRPKPMTVAWSRYAQFLTQKPVKGMLTGPITILQWSFVRDDQPRSLTARQLALAIRDEVLELERAGIGMIQIDEPALREGLPLRKREQPGYLRWAVDAFRLAANGVRNDTQIHTHMCYGEFNDIIRAIARMDADVISLETSRSQMELLEAFARFRYPNEIGPGVYDVHSPAIPSVEQMVALLERAAKLLPARNLWVNPDCGLKTRGWKETIPALQAMVAAARRMRGLTGKDLMFSSSSRNVRRVRY